MSTTPGRDEAKPSKTGPSPEGLEAAVGPWLNELPGVEAPASLRARVLLGAEFAVAPARPSWFVRNWGFGAMGAAAAMLLVALAVTTTERGTMTEGGGSREAGASLQARSTAHETRIEHVATADDLRRADPDLYVIQDPRLSLLHAVETFDGVDRIPGELISGLDR